MKYPVKVKYRGQVLAKIYKPSKNYPRYRVAWRVNGRRQMKAYATYSEAKTAADTLVEDLHAGSKVTALTPGQASDALAAFERLNRFYQNTGKHVSLLEAVSDYCEGSSKLGKYTLNQAIDGFLSTVATVKRMDLLAAAEELIALRQPKTVAAPGKRPQLSEGYHYNYSMYLTEFANTFPNSGVNELTKGHMDIYLGKQMRVGPKSRNERRNVVKMFLNWCVKKDYLAATHRLLEADGMVRENAEPATAECYTPNELKALLDRASQPPKPVKEGEEPEPDFRKLVPIIALVALGGVRLEEATRLTWEDVWRIPGHVEISFGKSKTRSRRLVTVCSELAQWLEPYKDRKGGLWVNHMDHWHSSFGDLLGLLEIKPRRNGLRHGFCSAHFAAHSNESLTAALAGNSPSVVHKHYKGLMTKKQGEQWFAVAPEQPANVIELSKAKQK